MEPDTSRKERWSLEQVVFTMFVLFLLSLFANYTAHFMTEYIFRTRIDHDLEQVKIVDRGVPQDELQTMLADTMGIEDFH